MEKVEAVEKVIESINLISQSSRTTWVKKDLDPVVDNLLDIWKYLTSDN